MSEKLDKYQIEDIYYFKEIKISVTIS